MINAIFVRTRVIACLQQNPLGYFCLTPRNGNPSRAAYHNQEWASKMDQSAHQCIKMHHVNQRTNL
jgi:hypothetical protein